MRPSVWTSYFLEQTPEEAIRLFASKSWKAVELSDEHGKVLLDRGDPAREGKNIRLVAEDLGVAILQGHLWLRCDIVGADGDRTVELLKSWLDLFHAAGARTAVLHPGGGELLKSGMTVADVNGRRIEALAKLAAHIAGSGLTISLENIVSQAPTADDLLAIIEPLGDAPLGICLDTGHLNMVGGNQADFIRRAGKRLLALHIADNEGATDQHLMPFGRGTVKWAEIAPALREVGYQGLFNYEIPGERLCPLDVQLAKLEYLHVVTRAILDA